MHTIWAYGSLTILITFESVHIIETMKTPLGPLNRWSLLFLVTNAIYFVGAIAIVKEATLQQTRTTAGDRVDEFDLPLIQTLGHKNFQEIPNLIKDQKVLVDCCQKAAAAFEAEGGDDGWYLSKPWKSSRIYMDGGKIWEPKQENTSTKKHEMEMSTALGRDAAFMEPIIREVRETLAPRLGLVPTGCKDSKKLQEAMPLEAAFCNFYIGIGDKMPRHMENHIDCNSQSVPVPLSCVVQGTYEHGVGTGAGSTSSSGPLGILDCQDRMKKYTAEAVPLNAGDALVLAGAWHQPRPVLDGMKRLVFVLFFSELNFVQSTKRRLTSQASEIFHE